MNVWFVQCETNIRTCWKMEEGTPMTIPMTIKVIKVPH